jgi:hypothetical protein
VRFQARLAQPVNGSSLAAFRFALGIVMSLEAYSLFQPNPAAINTGLSPLQTYFVGPDIKFHFSYEGFQWLPLLPAHWIYFLVGLQALAGLTMALGLFYRVSAGAVFLTWGYLFAVESTRTYWQSHYYLELLLTFLVIWMPANRRYSADAWLARERKLPRTVPYWTIVLLRGQLVIAYFYAGVAKLNADWLFDAVPTRWVLAQPGLMGAYETSLTSPAIQFIRGILRTTGCAYFINYAGALFDLSVGFLLLFRRTRLTGMILLVLFHATNHFIIFDDIGWFPLVGITTAFIFLEPNWLERLFNRLGSRSPQTSLKPKGSKASASRLSPKSSEQVAPTSKPLRNFAFVSSVSAWFVLVWLLWQALLPLRHLLIPADSRFTYEGQSFSWRLKADVRQASPAEIIVQDSTIISPSSAGSLRTRATADLTASGNRINWQEWHGDRVVYRRITCGHIDWERLPEIFVSLEPIIGERFIYNPYAGPATNRVEEGAPQRVRSLWQSLYGHQPPGIRPALGLTNFLGAISEGLSAGGNREEAAEVRRLMTEGGNAHDDLFRLLMGFHQRDRAGEMNALFRSLAPFALAGEPSKSGQFVVIEDPSLLTSQLHSRGDPVVIYTPDLGPEVKELLPQVCIFDSQESPGTPPYIWWNSPKDLTSSKLMHVSTQPFYLRRYALRVAEIWQRDYGRRPIVHAITSMSLNGRPPQPMVDPAVDLATARVEWLRHNPWIKDLETARIPSSAVGSNPGFDSR